MKFCDKHTAQMQRAIRDHGLWHRVSLTKSELAARAARFDPYDIDPLALLASMLMGRARHLCSVNGGVDFNDERLCPQCVFVGDPLTLEAAAQSVATRVATLDREKLADIQRNQELERTQR